MLPYLLGFVQLLHDLAYFEVQIASDNSGISALQDNFAKLLLPMFHVEDSLRDLPKHVVQSRQEDQVQGLENGVLHGVAQQNDAH